MARVQVDGVELGVPVRPDGVHEAQHVPQEPHRLGVLGLQRRVLDVPQAPVQRPVQVRDPGCDGRPHVV